MKISEIMTEDVQFGTIPGTISSIYEILIHITTQKAVVLTGCHMLYYTVKNL